MLPLRAHGSEKSLSLSIDMAETMTEITPAQWEAFQERLAKKRREEERLLVCPATGGKHQSVFDREHRVFCFQCGVTLERKAA